MRNALYRLIISSVTDLCYQSCFHYFEDNSRILDVGIGNGVMIRKFHTLIRTKCFKITGIDINQHYLKQCRHLIDDYQLSQNVSIFCQPVETFVPPDHEPFDYILFSMSFMLFNDPDLVLDRVKACLKTGGHIVFFQTMFANRLRLLDFVKPKLKFLTSIDFGRVVYDDQFFELLATKNLKVKEDRCLKKEWFRGEYRMIIV